MPTVFLSYRRSDTGGEAGRLADTFHHKMGGSLAFRDVADIPPGAQFDSMLDKELTAAKTVLVLIGPVLVDGTPTKARTVGYRLRTSGSGHGTGKGKAGNPVVA